MVQKLKFSKSVDNKKSAAKMIIPTKKKLERFGSFLTLKIDFESQNFAILTASTQLTARLKNLLRGWLLILGLKEGLVECVTVCVKSQVILTLMLYSE